jgi:hypothetical protein
MLMIHSEIYKSHRAYVHYCRTITEHTWNVYTNFNITLRATPQANPLSDSQISTHRQTLLKLGLFLIVKEKM